MCSINGSIVASYDKTTLVGSGKLTSTNGYYGLRFAHNTNVFVSNLLVTSTKLTPQGSRQRCRATVVDARDVAEAQETPRREPIRLEGKGAS